MWNKILQNFYNFSDDAARKSGGIGQNYAYPPAATYAAYPPYTAKNYGYEPPSYFTNVKPEAEGKYWGLQLQNTQCFFTLKNKFTRIYE